MANILWKSFLAFVLVSMLALPVTVGATPSTDQSNGEAGIESHTWGNYHWARTANPFTLMLGDNVNKTWDGHLATASNDWSQSTVLDTDVVAGGTKSKPCKPTTGRVEVCNDKYGKNGWLGIAQISISGDHITKGIVKVNDTYFTTNTYNTSEWRNMVMCQEIGHTFGLDHQDENFNNANLGTCMDYTNDPGTNQHPNQHDYEQLNAIYNHYDSTATIGSLSDIHAKGEFSTPAEWGKLIRTSADGHSALYLRDLGKGNKIITHVFWADQKQ